jgi:hypothetical protein
MFQKYKT